MTIPDPSWIGDDGLSHRTEYLQVECPNHDGHFDCTSFCSLCEGEQYYEIGI